MTTSEADDQKREECESQLRHPSPPLLAIAARIVRVALQQASVQGLL